MSTGTGKINISIPLRKHLFMNSGGLFPSVYAGTITQIAHQFQQQQGKFPQGEALQLITQRDQGGRTPLDIAW